MPKPTKAPPLDRQIAFLSHVDLLRGGSAEHIEPIANAMTVACYDAGEVLCQKGEVADSCIIMGFGKVDVVDGDGDDAHVYATIEPRACLAEFALIRAQPHRATARCRGRVTAFSLARTAYHELLARSELGALLVLDNLTAMLAHRVREVSQRYAKLHAAAGDGSAQKLTGDLQDLMASVVVG